ncbi:hypothetical protein ACI79D_19595 [Geodermatophilus sp. SYSU D00708]
MSPLVWLLVAWAAATAGTALWYARAFRRTECGPRGGHHRWLSQ